MTNVTIPPIALTGALRSGKNATADILTEKYGYTQFAFGDELKRTAHEVYDVPTDPKPRELYQWWGQTIRERDPDVWVRKCFEKIRINSAITSDVISRGFNVLPLIPVITDCRQPNEYSRCKDEGYVIFRVVCPVEVRIERAKAAGDAFTAENLTHDTESHTDGFDVDYTVVNDGTLADLERKIDAVMTLINAK